MGLFLLILTILVIILTKKTDYWNFCNPFFWIVLFWVLIIGIYLTAGINYKYGLSFWLVTFLLACTISMIFGVVRSQNKRINISSKQITRIPIRSYCCIGIIGGSIFILDYIRLNGIASAKVSSSISFIGSIGALCMPILMVLGLYLNAKSIRNYRKFSISGTVLMAIYTIPCMINAGREAILFCIIGLLCMFGYYKRLLKTSESTKKKSAKGFLIVATLGLSLIFLTILMLQITSARYTSNEINVLLTKRDFSSAAMDEASTWGDFQFLYYNIAAYFSHQIPFLDFTLREYDGPFLGGLFELNIISRRLPEALGLDYNLVFIKLENLFNIKGESFAGGWNTVLGSLISDFTWVGAIFICYWCGYIINIVKRKMKLTMDPKYVTLIALICLSSFSTIQLGPFFQIQIYGTYVWWLIIFRKQKSKKYVFSN